MVISVIKRYNLYMKFNNRTTLIWSLIIIIIVSVAYVLLAPIPVESPELDNQAGINGEPYPEVAKITSTEVAYYGDTNGYLAQPVAPGEYPGLILIHEWWGLNDNIEQLADEFAQQGYVALAVDLYDGQVADTPDAAGELAGAVRENTDLAFSNLEAATAYLKSLDSVDPDSLASVGWCFGGGWAYQMAANDLGVDASVMYYGRFSPEDDLSMMRADILGHFGEDDTSIAIDDVEQFQAKLKTLNGDHAVYIYPNAGHAFANEDNDEAYNEQAAELAWRRTLDFLSSELR